MSQSGKLSEHYYTKGSNEMEKRKFTIKEKVALIIIAALMVAAVVVGVVLIVGNTNRVNEELLNTEHTTVEIITEPETETETNADSTEKKAEGNTESKTNSAEQNSNPTEAKNTEPKTTNSTTSKATKSSGTENKTTNKPKDNSLKPEKVVPATNETHASDNILTVNGKKCYVGDTITVAINLKTPVILENYQGYTEFDNRYLEYVSAEMNSGGIYNEKDGVIYYNASILSGIDFTSEGTIYTATFKVKKEGSTQIKNTIQVLTDTNDKPVKLSDCKEEVKIYD